MNEKETTRLEQNKRGKGKQVFVLREDGTLLVTLSKGGNIQHFSITLAGWDPEFAHEKNDPKLSRVVFRIISVFLCTFMALVVIAFLFNVKDQSKSIFPIVFVCTILGIAWRFLYNQYQLRNYDLLIFRNPMTGGQLVLHYNVPNEKEFSEFLKKLQDSIKKHPYVSPAQIPSKTAELREFAQLRDEGVITSEEFEETKRKLLSTINTSSNMGFRP